VVDTKAGDKVSAVATGQEGTHMVAVSPDGRLAYTANIPAGTVTVIDLAARRKLRDLAVGGRPEGIALARGGRELWVGDLQGARVQAFDTRSFRRLAQVPTGPVPIRVLVSPDGRWVVTSNLGNGSLTVIDARTRKAVRDVTVSGTEAAGQVTILFSADSKRLYAAETGATRWRRSTWRPGACCAGSAPASRATGWRSRRKAPDLPEPVSPTGGWRGV
jgi:YVTN family beta-propeller protein